MGMITLDEKERVFCRKLISIVRDLTLDAVQVLEIITSVQAESVRETANQDLYVSKLADLAGLRYSNFGYSAIENLSANGIVSRSYMDIRVKSGLTDLGIDLSERVRNA
jgi:predicted transcriptional regulator